MYNIWLVFFFLVGKVLLLGAKFFVMRETEEFQQFSWATRRILFRVLKYISSRSWHFMVISSVQILLKQKHRLCIFLFILVIQCIGGDLPHNYADSTRAPGDRWKRQHRKVLISLFEDSKVGQFKCCVVCPASAAAARPTTAQEKNEEVPTGWRIPRSYCKPK